MSEGKCTIAAGLPPPSRSVNAFSMLKGSVWERALIVIARKLFEYSGGNRVWVWVWMGWGNNMCVLLEFLLRIIHAANEDEETD